MKYFSNKPFFYFSVYLFGHYFMVSLTPFFCLFTVPITHCPWLFFFFFPLDRHTYSKFVPVSPWPLLPPRYTLPSFMTWITAPLSIWFPILPYLSPIHLDWGDLHKRHKIMCLCSFWFSLSPSGYISSSSFSRVHLWLSSY